MTRQDLRSDHKWGLVPMEVQTSPQAPAHQANQMSPWQRAMHQAPKSIWNLWGLI